MAWVVIFAPGLVLAAGLVFLLRAPRPSFGNALARGIGWIGAASIPGAAALTRFVVGDARPPVYLLPVPFLGSWWVALGGGSTILFFEETAKAVTGHRQSTMLDNLPYFLALVAVKAIVLASIVAWRLRKGRPLWDPVVVAVAVLVGVDAWLADDWRWTGT